MQQQVGQVAFGIDQNGRHALHCRFFHQVNAQAGLARPGHSGYQRMGGQVGRIVLKDLVGQFIQVGVKYFSKIKFVGHGLPPVLPVTLHYLPQNDNGIFSSFNDVRIIELAAPTTTSSHPG